MRVLLFRMLCDTGGVSSSMLLLGREMALRGIDCEYWFCKPSIRWTEFLETGRATLAPVSKLADRLQRGDFDVVHMTASDPAAEVVASMAGPARVVVTARGALSDIWNRSNCFAYSAISHGMAQVNQPYTDVEIEVVRNAIDLARFSPPNPKVASTGAPIIAFAGRTTSHEKDFPRFTRIARRLVDSGARVWIADPHHASWERFDGQPVERFTPERWEPVRHQDIPDFYRAVTMSGGVVLMTSHTEGFGNVAPEAAACGARVAAPDVMGLREAIIDGQTGRLFPANASDDDVADRLRTWMAEPHDAQACADTTRAAFKPSVTMDGYQHIYERQEQRPRRDAAPEPEYAERAHLLDHLHRQRGWRAQFARTAALDLAGAGHSRLALDALGVAFRAAPRDFLGKGGARDLLSVGRRMILSARRS